MLSSNPDSSPLSSPPSSLASSLGFPSPNGVLLPHETIERNPNPLIEEKSPTVPSVSAPGSEAGSPSPSTADVTANLAPKQSPKRVLEEVEEVEENILPPKKRKYQSKAASRKTKAAAPNKITAKTATATESSVTPKQPARKKATTAPPTQSTRPTRNRKAPERFEEEQPAPKATPRRGPSKVFDPVFITTNSTSRLVKADVYVSPTILAHYFKSLMLNSTCYWRIRHGQVLPQSNRLPYSKCYHKTIPIKLFSADLLLARLK